uniref:Uncharacterized protein n=1 Tax=Arundo donax TaxID=35708 RepID=A0A0A9B1P3_ARUDO
MPRLPKLESSLTQNEVPISSYLQCHLVPPRLVDIFYMIEKYS